MSIEKASLAKELGQYLGDSEYFYLADFSGMTVQDTQALRQKLAVYEAEFHVTKNRIFRHVMRGRGLALEEKLFSGPTALIAGGKSPSEVAKVVKAFRKEKEKLSLKGGALGERPLSAQDVDALANLPTRDVLRAQLLSLFNTPAQQFLRVCHAPLLGVCYALKAKAEALEGEAPSA